MMTSIADSPTTSFQRLKALVTGSLRAFIEIGQNFNSKELSKDNLIFSLKRNEHKKIFFVVDDIWMHMFPSQFDFQYPMDSFNVKDY